MIFAQSYYAWVLLIVAGLILFFVWAGRQRRKNIDLFISRGLSADMAGMVNRKQQVIKIALIIFACLFLSFALMRPQWGFKWQEVKRQGLDILIALDTSKSMLASDIKPNRLERSKLAIKDLIQKLSGDRVGLIAFAGSAYLQCPLTGDYEGFLLALANLDTDTIGIPGTSLAAAIEEALKVFKGGDKKYQALIIITDGEDHQGGVEALAKKAQSQGIKIFSVGIGTGEGELIQIEGNFLKDKQGNVVKTRLNETILRQIASLSEGMYVHSSPADFGLETIYRERLSKMDKQDISETMKKRYHERFQIFIALAIICLLVEPFVSDRKRL